MIFSLKRRESLSPPAPARDDYSRLIGGLSEEDHRTFRAGFGWKCAIGQEYYNKTLNICVELKLCLKSNLSLFRPFFLDLHK